MKGPTAYPNKWNVSRCPIPVRVTGVARSVSCGRLRSSLTPSRPTSVATHVPSRGGQSGQNRSLGGPHPTCPLQATTWGVPDQLTAGRPRFIAREGRLASNIYICCCYCFWTLLPPLPLLPLPPLPPLSPLPPLPLLPTPLLPLLLPPPPPLAAVPSSHPVRIRSAIACRSHILRFLCLPPPPRACRVPHRPARCVLVHPSTPPVAALPALRRRLARPLRLPLLLGRRRLWL